MKKDVLGREGNILKGKVGKGAREDGLLSKAKVLRPECTGGKTSTDD